MGEGVDCGENVNTGLNERGGREHLANYVSIFLFRNDRSEAVRLYRLRGSGRWIYEIEISYAFVRGYGVNTISVL